MTRIDQIELALKAINQAKFQKLCDRYFSYLGYDVRSHGSVIGLEKTRKGTPDSYFVLDNGKYACIEYTTTQEGLFKKLLKDIEACFDPKKVKIPVQKIEKIILCFNSRLSLDEVNKLIEKCQEKNVLLDLLDIDKLSDEIYKYPQLAKDFLDIEFDTGQILRPQDFIKIHTANPVKIPLNQKFHFREAALQQGLEALNNDGILLVSGPAGVGKTRFALELGGMFCSQYPQYEFLIIYHKDNLDLYPDIRTYLTVPNRSFLILVDDANQITLLDRLLQLPYENPYQNFKIILTVRDYAQDEVKRKVKNYVYQEIKLNKFSDAEIEKLIEEEYQISNKEYQQRIVQIANGNARLAVMASIKANHTQRLDKLFSLFSIQDIYENFFEDVLRKIENENPGKSKLLQKVLGLMSFFRFTHKQNQIPVFRKIEEVFGVTYPDFWDTLLELHRWELIDVYKRNPNEQIAKIADQTLATYFFYKVFIQDQLLDYGVLLEHFFKGYEVQIEETIYSTVNNFDFYQISKLLEPTIKNKWESDSIQLDEQSLFQFAKIFWFVLPTEILNYLYDRIILLPDKVEMPTASEYSEDIYIEILKRFRQIPDDHFISSLEVLFSYLKKNHSTLEMVIQYFKEDLIFNYRSYQTDFFIQEALFDVLFQQIRDHQDEPIFQEVVYQIIPEYLQTSFQEAIPGRIQTFVLPLNKTIKKFRREIWDFLFRGYSPQQSDPFSPIFKSYLYHYGLKIQKDIWAFDASLILPFLENRFDNSAIENSYLVQDYLKRLNTFNIPYNYDTSNIERRFSNQIIELRKLLSWDEDQLIRDEDRYRENKQKEISSYFQSYNLTDYQQFIQYYQKNHEDHPSEHWAYQRSLILIFEDLFSKDKSLLLEVLGYLFSIANPIQFTCYPLVSKILSDSEMNARYFYALIQPTHYHFHSLWKLHFFEALPEKFIDAFYIDKLLENYAQLESGLIMRFKFLEKYQKFRADIFEQSIEQVVEKMSQPDFYIAFYVRFWEEEAFFFKKNKAALKKIYFYQLDQNQASFDYTHAGFNFLVDIDEDFIFEYLNRQSRKSFVIRQQAFQKFKKLWNLENYEAIITKIVDFLLDNQWHYEPNELAFALFDPSTYLEEKTSFIEKIIRERHDQPKVMELIFGIILFSFPERKAEYLQILLNLNPDIALFQRLPLVETDYFLAIDEIIPWKKARIQDWQAIQQLLKGARFLNHRVFVEREIADLSQDINRQESEKQDPSEDAKYINNFFNPIFTPEIKILYLQLKKKFPFLEFIIWTTRWFNHWTVHLAGKFYTLIEVEAEEDAENNKNQYAEAVFHFLKEKYPQVFLEPTPDEIDLYLGYERDTLVVKTLLENAPIKQLLIKTASLEKILVDIHCNPELFAAYQDREKENIYVNVFERYAIDINEDKMILYAQSYDNEESKKFPEYIQKIKNILQTQYDHRQ